VVPWWVPIATAAIAAVPVALGVLYARRSTREETVVQRDEAMSRHTEVALAGLTSLIAAVTEERNHHERRAAECEKTLVEETRHRRRR
jgi:hypothetical protein